ncbi:3-aminobutyryl-CoA ammonia lyase [Mesorhizobium sp. B2-4-15]|uniref:3-aminobutyryl-CoA ammonia lyase n=1 Tax=Mesorhizobium sp. B2-4-15 TaxID=2589934 RepID=UPI00114EA558|nr:3-aminobutyryl-CoA ammonia lyase [Mesorhizobium sp. B2-4-15]TPK73613.1 3-aminobutyryl-CoA ammonia lyase [Mesorhizobium sp. B2-4-15]
MEHSLIRLRLSSPDGHYSGALLDQSKMLQIFGDAVTEIMINVDDHEGSLKSLDAEFVGTLRTGEYLEVGARLTRRQGGLRQFECTAHKLIELIHKNGGWSAHALAEPQLVAKAVAVAMTHS